MIRRIKRLFESMAYAGLKPGAPAAAAKHTRWLGSLRARLEPLLSGSASADPLYLSNRTTGQKLKTWALIGVPALILIAGVALGLADYFGAVNKIQTLPVGPSKAEIAQRMLPNLNSAVITQMNHDLDVQDVHIVPGGQSHLAGIARNNTNHAIRSAEIVFELTDRVGSRQGAVSGRIANIGAKSEVPFQFAIEQRTAALALVREVRIE